MDLSGLGLPDSIRATVQQVPVEDLLLRVLKAAHPDVAFFTLIPLDQTGEVAFPNGNDMFVLLRKVPGLLTIDYDSRFVDACTVSVQVFCRDPDGDQRAALVSEALRVSLHAAARDPVFYPGLGSIIGVAMDEAAVRKTDWASSTGPVQYAELPTGFTRYEAQYAVTIRRDVWT